MCTCSASIQSDCFVIVACGKGAAGLHRRVPTGHRQVRVPLQGQGFIDAENARASCPFRYSVHDPTLKHTIGPGQAAEHAFPDLGVRRAKCSTLGTALFHEPIVHEGHEGIVVVRDIDFASTSEVNLLPFHGRCHVAYVPRDGVVLGLSKLARLTKQYAKRLQTQERLGMEITQSLMQHLACEGVAVVLQARHLVNSSQPLLRTTGAVSGCFSAAASGGHSLPSCFEVGWKASHVRACFRPCAARCSAVRLRCGAVRCGGGGGRMGCHISMQPCAPCLPGTNPCKACVWRRLA